MSDRIKCQDVEPASAEETASFTCLCAAPSFPLGMAGGGFAFLRVSTDLQPHQLGGALVDSSDNIVSAHVYPLYFNEESLHKMMERFGLD